MAGMASAQGATSALAVRWGMGMSPGDTQGCCSVVGGPRTVQGCADAGSESGEARTREGAVSGKRKAWNHSWPFPVPPSPGQNLNELEFLESGEEFLEVRVIVEERESLGRWLWIISKLSLNTEQKEWPLGPWGGFGRRDLPVLGSVTCQSCDLEQVTALSCSVVEDAEAGPLAHILCTWLLSIRGALS